MVKIVDAKTLLLALARDSQHELTAKEWQESLKRAALQASDKYIIRQAESGDTSAAAHLLRQLQYFLDGGPGVEDDVKVWFSNRIDVFFSRERELLNRRANMKPSSRWSLKRCSGEALAEAFCFDAENRGGAPRRLDPNLACLYYYLDRQPDVRAVFSSIKRWLNIELFGNYVVPKTSLVELKNQFPEYKNFRLDVLAQRSLTHLVALVTKKSGSADKAQEEIHEYLST